MNKSVSFVLAVGVVLVVLALLVAPSFGTEPRSAPLLDGPFPIADLPTQAETYPRVAHDVQRNRYLVVYVDVLAVKAMCLSPRGEPLVQHLISTNGDTPDIVYNAGHDQYLIVWQENAQVRGAFLAGNCEPGGVSPTFPISAGGPGNAQWPRVAYNNHHSHHDYLVVWWEDTTNSSVWARRASATGPSGSSFLVAGGPAPGARDPDVAYNLNHNEYLVVYAQHNAAGTEYDIYGRRVHNAGGGGLLPAQAIDTSVGQQFYPAVAAYHWNQTNPYLVVFWEYGTDLQGDARGYLCAVNGQPAQGLAIATVLGRAEGVPAVASSHPMGYTVVWDQSVLPPGRTEVYGRRVTGTGIMQPPFGISAGGRLLPSDHFAEMAHVAGGSPTAVVVWHERSPNMTPWDVWGRALGYRVYLPLTIR